MKKITLAQIDKIAKEVTNEYFDGLKEEDIRFYIKNLLEKQSQKIILESMGLEKSWGSDIEVRYSGTFRDNAKLLTEQMLAPIAKNIYNEITKDVKIDFTEQQKVSLRKVYREFYIETLEGELRQMAVRKAEQDAGKLFADYMNSLEEQESDLA
jgi:hypothetical protein